MPTNEELDELITKCTWTWGSRNGINGYIVVGPNGNALFLPAAGCRDGSLIYDVGSYGDYWSSSLDSYRSSESCDLYFGAGYFNLSGSDRNAGCAVRPVCQ